MDYLKKNLPPKIFTCIEKVGLNNLKDIVTMSTNDLRMLTNLSNKDVLLLKEIVAFHLSPQSITSDKIIEKPNETTTGCLAFDQVLNGGYRKGTVTEIYGESGSGKTQMMIFAAISNWSNGCVYICTEGLFPVKRYEQMKENLADYNKYIDYGKNIFIEHILEVPDLLSCVRVRLQKLLQKNCISLVVIDSVAAPFRSECTNYIQRAEKLRELAVTLICLAQEHNFAVVCVNQVTSSLEVSNVLPSLGLAWSNMVSTRLWLKKTNESVHLKTDHCKEQLAIREMCVMFAPDVANAAVKFIITQKGIQTC